METHITATRPNRSHWLDATTLIATLRLLLLVLPLVLPLWAHAQSLPAVTFPSSNLAYFAGSTAVVGYSFTVNSPIYVTDLGQYDVGLDGLSAMAQVGLWTDIGTLLAESTISSGTIVPIDNGFRYVSLQSPILLSVGQTYVVGGRAGSSDQTVFLQHNAIFASEISYDAGWFGPNGSFAFPNISGGGTASSAGDFGGSFRFISVPEPSDIALLIAGALTIVFIRRRQMMLNHALQPTPFGRG